MLYIRCLQNPVCCIMVFTFNFLSSMGVNITCYNRPVPCDLYYCDLRGEIRTGNTQLRVVTLLYYNNTIKSNV